MENIVFFSRVCFIVIMLMFCLYGVDSYAKSTTNEKYSALVIEADSGRIYFERSGSARRYPASLTKMMTLYLAFQALESGRLRLDSSLRVSYQAEKQPPSKLGLKAGTTIRAYDAIMALITKSANDAAVVLAEAMAGSVTNFAHLMTRQAQALGMDHTVFKNPNGLPDKSQYTTARDMAKLGHALIYHYPGYYPYFSHTKFNYKGRVYGNHNNLMRTYKGMDGIKTGYIDASGFNLVASAERNGTRLIGVVFGGQKSASRDAHMKDILDKAFARIEKGRTTGFSRVPMPEKNPAIFKSPRVIEKPAKSKKTKKLEMVLPKDGQTIIGAGGWGIQVGAYSEVGAAQKTLDYISSELSKYLDRAEPSLQKITLKDGSAVYRARFTGVDQATARQVCSFLVEQGHGCLVVTGP